MKLQLIKIERSRVREPYMSFAANGGVHVNKVAAKMVNIANAKSVNIYQDKDYDKNFFIQFMADDSGEIKLRASGYRMQFSSRAIYRMMKEAFDPPDKKTLVFRVGKPFEIAPGTTVYPLLTNNSSRL